jgi:hypothetical protein
MIFQTIDNHGKCDLKVAHGIDCNLLSYSLSRYQSSKYASRYVKSLLILKGATRASTTEPCPRPRFWPRRASSPHPRITPTRVAPPDIPPAPGTPPPTRRDARRPRHSRPQSPPFPTLCTKCPHLRPLHPLRHPAPAPPVLPVAMSPPPSLGMHAVTASLPPHPPGVQMLRDGHDRALSR